MGKRIFLRNMKKEDEQDLFEIFSDPFSTRYWIGRCTTKDELKRMLRVEYFSYSKRGLSPPQVIVLDHRVIGVVTLMRNLMVLDELALFSIVCMSITVI